MTTEEKVDAIFEIQKKYEEKQVEILKKALTYEIGTNTKMIEALEQLNQEYLDEVVEFDEFCDFNPGLIDNFKDAERDGRNVITEAKTYLEVYETLIQKRLVFVDEDGNVCDEYSNRLSEDGEHRVFEAIKGGKKK